MISEGTAQGLDFFKIMVRLKQLEEIDMTKQIKKRFSIYQPMTCGSYEAEIRKYKLLIGKSGKRWLVAIQENEADNIYVEGDKNSDGFGGRTLIFKLENGDLVTLTGPWQSNSDALFCDTGYDIRDKYLTKGIIALNKEPDALKGDLYLDILFEDKDWVLGEFDRIKKIAQGFANKLGTKIYFAKISKEGGESFFVKPYISNMEEESLGECKTYEARDLKPLKREEEDE